MGASLDVTNQAAVEWFTGRLRRFSAEFGVDSFKFDAGELTYLPPTMRTALPLHNLNRYTTLYVNMAASFGRMVEVGLRITFVASYSTNANCVYSPSQAGQTWVCMLIRLQIVTSPPGGVRSFVMSMVVYLSVCLPVRSRTTKPRGLTLPKFLCMLPMAAARSSCGGAEPIRYVLPVLRMTCVFAHYAASGQNQSRRYV